MQKKHAKHFVIPYQTIITLSIGLLLNVGYLVHFIVLDNLLLYLLTSSLDLFVTQAHHEIPKINYSLPLFLAHFVKKNWLWFGLYLAGLILNSQHTTIYSTIFGQGLDAIVANGAFTWTNGWKQLLMYLAASVVLSATYSFTSYMSAWLIPWLAGEIRGYFFKYVMGHSYFYFSQTLSGDILTKMNNITSSSLRIIHFVFEEAIPVTVLSFTALFFFIREYPQFQVTLIGWMFVHVFISLSRLPQYIRVSLDNAKQYSGLMGIVGNILHNIFAIKFLYSLNFERKYFDKYQYRDIESFRKMRMYNTMTEIMMDTCAYTVFYGFIFIYQIMKGYIDGALTLGASLSIYNILRSVASQVWKTTENIGDMMIDISRCQDAMEILKISNSVADSHPDVELEDGGKLHGSLEVRNVYFYYNNQDKVSNSKAKFESYLFEDLNFTIAPYQKVAFVGSSGSGKSTITNLFLRLMDPIRGEIYMNGQDISKISKSSLRNAISFIPQREFIFNRPLFENIGYGCPEVREEFLLKNHNMDVSFKDLNPETQEKIVEAAKKSESHGFIINLPKGYDSIYGSDVRLSGGQCQRIMIARAFINTRAQFLILDEATSALDPETEKSIQRSVDMMSEGKTVVVIAHRLNTIRDFDRIIVFDKGSIVEDGKHDELMKKKGKYYSMWQSQTNIV